MGVYLSNIEMPRTHPITVEIYPDGTVLSKTVGRRDIHGTAIPVPPHGRLIDADKLGFAMKDAANADQALSMVDDAPTVIEAEGTPNESNDA